MMDELESESRPLRRDISMYKIYMHKGKLHCGRVVYDQNSPKTQLGFPFAGQFFYNPFAAFKPGERDLLVRFIDTKLPKIAYCENIEDLESFDPAEFGISLFKWASLPVATICWHPENFGYMYIRERKPYGAAINVELERFYKTREWVDLLLDTIQQSEYASVFLGEEKDIPFCPNEDRDPPEFPLVKPAATLKKQPGKTFQDRLWNAGYYRYLRARDAERLFAEAKASDPDALRLPSVGRQYFGDSEELAETGLEPFFQLAWDFLKLQKVKPPLMSSLNPPEFEHGGPDEEAASVWALHFLNKRLEQVGSPERAYAVNDGNDLNIIFLTPAQYRIIRAHPDYDPIGDPHPL